MKRFVYLQQETQTRAYCDIAWRFQFEICQKDASSILVKTTDLSRNGIRRGAHFNTCGMPEVG